MSKVLAGPLKVALILALVFVMIRLGEFAFTHMPPYSEGDCVEAKESPAVVAKIEKNHIMDGYSDVEIQVLIYRYYAKASFIEQREVLGKKVKCE